MDKWICKKNKLIWVSIMIPSLLGPLWPAMVAPDRVLSELFDMELFLT